MGIQAPAEVKFALIYEAIQHDDNALSISYMCQIAGVSRSGFYAWMSAAPARQKREDHDLYDICPAHVRHIKLSQIVLKYR